MKEGSGSVLSDDRKRMIRAQRVSILPALKDHRLTHRALMASREIDLGVPAWIRVNPGPRSARTRNAYRLCIGFQNVGCKYRERDPTGLGCLMCGYYARTAFKDVPKDTIIEQFKSGLRQGYSEATRFNSIEFLNDGSFLNRDEFDQETQAELLGMVARMPYIDRVLVESRPEHVKVPALKFLLQQLREDQLLEVGIGLETADDFIRDVCINKGSTRKNFEHAIAQIARLTREAPRRLSAVAYLLVKPPFLTERESIEDTVATMEYLRALSAQYGVHIAAKLEPAAIANGTILSLLYLQADPALHYEPPSYWAVLEILARTARKSGSEPADVRVGAREDMDDVLKAPAIYNADGETFHPFDFVVYESIQKFNQHQKLRRAIAIASEVYKRFYRAGLDSTDSSLVRWLVANAIDDSAIVGFARQHGRGIASDTRVAATRYDIELMSMIYAVLDIMEYGKNSGDLKQKIDDALLAKNDKALGVTIDECFKQIAPKALLQSTVIAARHESKYGEVFFDVKDLLKDQKISVWSRFALASKVVDTA
jgi:radical SAM enzyme (TIGR01210 family)